MKPAPLNQAKRGEIEPSNRKARGLKFWAKRGACIWLLLLLASTVYRWQFSAPPEVPAGAQALELARMDGAEAGTETTELHWFESEPQAGLNADGESAAPTVLLLHGSPGSHADFDALTTLLNPRFRVLVPDLPGFGVRHERLPDYSPLAHAHYLARWLTEIDAGPVHVLGFSMGGAVGLRLWELDPERVASLTMLAAIGVEELELLGDQTLNHGLHGLLLGAVRAIDWGVPHFGAFDSFPVGVAHARNFFDAQQDQWRGLLETFDRPALVLHGAQDILVPEQAAREHARIMPQARIVVWPDQNHFLPWSATAQVAEEFTRFVDAASSGKAATRASAAPDRVAAATPPFDPRSIPPASGFTVAILIVLLALATLVSEDLTCLAAGWLVAQGRLEFLPAAFGCFIGILIGDLALYGIGRIAGRPALERRPLSRWVKPESLHKAASWLDRQGAKVVFLSRFTPGLRLPTYLLAGALRTRFVPFALYFALASALWTPVLVGLSAWLGERFLPRDGDLSSALWRAVPWIIAVWGLLHFLLIPALTHAGRRRLRGRWKRLTEFEYWPRWAIYGPLLPYLIWQALRYRSLTVFSAANPGMQGGGFAGESKEDILRAFGDHPAIARFIALPGACSIEAKLERIAAWRARFAIDFPIVIKPDAGERGKDVRFAHNAQELHECLEQETGPAQAQEFLTGIEFGVFFLRDPATGLGRVTSITEKILPFVTGDGRRTVERLVLDDARAVAMESAYRRNLGGAWDTVPASGERVALVQVGTHSRGAIFRNGVDHLTPELEAAIQKISDAMRPLEGTPEGVHALCLGRYDLKVPSVDHFRRGADLRIIEVNGVTSEPTHIYDARESVWSGWRILARQWAQAYSIGAYHREKGVRVDSIRDLWRIARPTE